MPGSRVVQSPVLLCPVLPCAMLLCPVLPCALLLCPVLPCAMLLCPVLPCAMLLCPVLPCMMPSCPRDAAAVLLPVPHSFLSRVLQGPRVGETLVKPSGEQLGRLMALVGEGKLRLTVSASFPLAEAAKAAAQVDGGHTRGKVVLTV
jgi:hypothetical protein